MKNNKEKERIESFSSQFDGDEKLASKGKLLITSSLILFALEVTGATIKEANTFLFKIDFTNQHGVTYLLISAILYLSIRYFNYAQPYHHELFLLWSSRMMSDREIFSYNPNDDCVHGFLSDAINVWGGDEPGIRDVRYVKFGIFSRGLIYPIHHKDEGVEDSYDEYINLCAFSEKWTRLKYTKLLCKEARYRILAFIKHREHLDLLSPYLMALVAVLSVVCTYHNASL